MSFLVNFWLGLGNPRHIATISQHLWAFPRQIRFWSILKKSWDWVRPPPPPWAKIPTFTENLFCKLPLASYKYFNMDKAIENTLNVFDKIEGNPKMPDIDPVGQAIDRDGTSNTVSDSVD